MVSKHDALSCSQNWGYSEKIGPVYLNDREENISASKREEIENEVRR
jgi:ATP-dependent metalloprotease